MGQKRDVHAFDGARHAGRDLIPKEKEKGESNLDVDQHILEFFVIHTPQDQAVECHDGTRDEQRRDGRYGQINPREVPAGPLTAQADQARQRIQESRLDENVKTQVGEFDRKERPRRHRTMGQDQKVIGRDHDQPELN